MTAPHVSDQVGRLSEAEVRRWADELHCPWCHKGPWKTLAGHTVGAHGINAQALRDAGGYSTRVGLASDGLRERRREIALDANNLEGAERPDPATRHVSVVEDRRRKVLAQDPEMRRKGSATKRDKGWRRKTCRSGRHPWIEGNITGAAVPGRGGRKCRLCKDEYSAARRFAHVEHPESVERSAIRAAVKDGRCPWCTSGPYQQPIRHAAQAHGIPASWIQSQVSMPPEERAARAENARRQLGARNVERAATMTRCRSGRHSWTPETTRVRPSGRRYCIECAKESSRRRKARTLSRGTRLDGQVAHGLTGYTTYGCRCAACKAAGSAYRKGHRRGHNPTNQQETP